MKNQIMNNKWEFWINFESISKFYSILKLRCDFSFLNEKILLILNISKNYFKLFECYGFTNQ